RTTTGWDLSREIRHSTPFASQSGGSESDEPLPARRNPGFNKSRRKPRRARSTGLLRIDRDGRRLTPILVGITRHGAFHAVPGCAAGRPGPFPIEAGLAFGPVPVALEFRFHVL